MKRKLVDEIGTSSARVLQMSWVTLVASGTALGIIWGGRFIQPLEKPAQRVFLMAIATGVLSAAGVFAAAYISEGTSRSQPETEPPQKKL
jgi:hypothetical protein